MFEKELSTQVGQAFANSVNVLESGVQDRLGKALAFNPTGQDHAREEGRRSHF